jgi:hypothetical protein
LLQDAWNDFGSSFKSNDDDEEDGDDTIGDSSQHNISVTANAVDHPLFPLEM